MSLIDFESDFQLVVKFVLFLKMRHDKRIEIGLILTRLHPGNRDLGKWTYITDLH